MLCWPLSLLAALAVGSCDLPSGAGSRADAAAVAAARTFLASYSLPSGRVVRRDQGSDTVSEGQAYAMLAAAAIGDRRRFGAVWRWTRLHLRRPDGLFSWHWVGGSVVDPQPAADADLEIARALLVGACRWRAPALRRQALAVGRALLAHETATRGGRLIMAAGPWATGSPVTVNPSYFDPAALRGLARWSGDRRFTTLAVGTRSVVAAVSRPLPPDWATVDDRGVATASGPPGQMVAPSYGYDAPRTLVWLASDGTSAGRAAARAAWPALRSDVPRHPLAAVADAAAAAAAGATRERDRLLAEADRLAIGGPTYYGVAWRALGRLLLTTDRLSICTPRTTRSSR